MKASIVQVFTSAGVELRGDALRRAAARLRALGYAVELDASVALRHQRFAGSDEQRLATLHRVADAAPSIAMACRGGYGMTRLLDAIDWKRVARSISKGTRWVGYSDMTALQMGVLAHRGAPSWAGPMACDDFGRPDAEGGVDDVTRDCFVEAMSGALHAVGFRTEAGFDGLHAKGVLWGGNLAMLCSMLGTSHFPRVKGGILFVEDVNEHPYRVERCLLQLQQAGVLKQQKAVLLGAVSDYRVSPLDRGYTLKSMVAYLRSTMRVPLVTGFPFGHVRTKVTFPLGQRVELVVQGRDVLVGWA
ncbi:MAG TPA: LD-carboxypeptidase [Burkholderiaceae bacterium]|nr:LD-carboxypeptidase [Burkholderiaceae bacterium]